MTPKLNLGHKWKGAQGWKQLLISGAGLPEVNCPYPQKPELILEPQNMSKWPAMAGPTKEEDCEILQLVHPASPSQFRDFQHP
jgi:hypothetical protein